MKYLLFVLITISFGRSYSQILFAGNHVIEGYLGMPNTARFSGGINFATGETNEGDITRFSGFAPSGLRYGYMLTDNISVGLDLIYNYSNVLRSTTDTLYNGITGQWEYQNSSTQDITKRFRCHFRMNFHIQTGRPESDSYFGIGVGSNNRWISKYENNQFIKTLKGSDASLLPFSMRICYGYRYFFGYNWGISGEIGLGGPLLSLGVSYKL
jgi:hypothetical protein